MNKKVDLTLMPTKREVFNGAAKKGYYPISLEYNNNQ
jgi:hypothetical protein